MPGPIAGYFDRTSWMGPGISYTASSLWHFHTEIMNAMDVAITDSLSVEKALDILGQMSDDGEIDRQYVDSTKLRETTGWRPRVELAEGLRQTLEWYREHPEARPEK